MEYTITFNLTAEKKPENAGKYLIVTKKFKAGSLITVMDTVNVSAYALLNQNDPFDYENKEAQVVAWAELPDVADQF